MTVPARRSLRVLIGTLALLAWGPGILPAAGGEGHHHGTELGLSLSAVKVSHAAGLLAGLHLHVSRRLAASGPLSFLAAVVGGEALLGGDPHTALHAGIALHPWKGLALGLYPGILWATEDGVRETRFALHWEVSYGFDLARLEVGPVVEIAWAGKDRHYAAGVHLGF